MPNDAEATDAPPTTDLMVAAAALRHRLDALRAAGLEHVVTERGPLGEAAAMAGRDGATGKVAAPGQREDPPAQSRRVPGLQVQQPLGGSVKESPPRSVTPQTFEPQSQPLPARAPMARPATRKPGTFASPVMVPSVAAGDLEKMGGARATSLAAMAQDVSRCAQCRLCETRTQTVFSRGNPNSPLMFIGEAPGADEDEQGRPFVGRAGQLLDDILTKGMKYPPEDVYIANVLKCRPPNNRNPEPDEIEACRGYLRQQIEVVDPMVIIALGRFPAQWLLDSQEPIGKLRGKLWDVGGRKVLCTYHPAYLLRNPPAKAEVWKDVQIVMDYFGRGKPLPMRTG